jgi:hypothetical protein
MRALYKATLLLAVGALWVGIGASLRAATPIFDNSVNDLVHQFDPGTLEVGDEITLGGTERYLTHFDFEYWSVTANPDHVTFAGTVQARVRFYVNDGTPFNGYATPGFKFYDSGWFDSFPATDQDPFRGTIGFNAGSDFPSGGLFIPADHMTWSVQFQGLGLGDQVGLDLYSPPVVGAEVGDFGDYWQNNGTSWSLLTNTVPMDFAARMYAQVPEPSAVTLSIIGGLGILTLVRRLRRQE